MTVTAILLHVSWLMAAADAVPLEARRLFLSDANHLFLSAQQGWGKLGLDTAAHAAGVEPLPLQIKDQKFKKGLGHHAPGAILVALDGQFARFEAQVGVQQQGGQAGSVVFKVFVDHRLAFESGVMRQTDAAKAVSVPLSGAEELRLIVEDGGDGVAHDVANWAAARLIRDEAVSKQDAIQLDAGRYGQIITCDPGRADGARAARTEEYRQEDVYLERPAPRNAEGDYPVPIDAEGRGCLGIRWLEARRVLEIRPNFAEPYPDRDLERAKFEYWEGPTLWQGRWQPLPGQSRVRLGVLTHIVDTKHASLANGTRKLRIVFPNSSKPMVMDTISVLTPTVLRPLDLVASLESSTSEKSVEVRMYNGRVLEASQNHNSRRVRGWDGREPLKMRVLSSRPRRWKGDQTVLRFHLPGEKLVAVAMDDVISHGCVYVPHVGLFVRLKEKEIMLATYKEQVASRETVLDQTRRMPDQTFEQAMAKVHRAKQDLGPMLLSLACDNHKFVAQRDGGILKVALPDTDYSTMVGIKTTSRVLPKFGTGKEQEVTRHLDGDWMPIPVTTAREGGVVYQQRTYVAPFGSPPKSLCVAEYTITNTSHSDAPIHLQLRFQAGEKEDDLAAIDREGVGFVAHRDGRMLACLKVIQEGDLEVATALGEIQFHAVLPADRSVKLVCYVPHWETPRGEQRILSNANPERLLESVKAHWEQATAPAMGIELPDALLVNVIKASQVHCLLAARSEADGRRIAPWISSDRYGPLESESNSIIRGMDFLGYHDFAQRSLDFFIHRYNDAGYLTTGYTMMGTGWHLWMLGEHYALTKDKAWLKRHASEVKRICEWIVAQREKTLQGCADVRTCPERGLMPPGVMADWSNYAYYFCLNGYYCAGLKGAAEALADIGVSETKPLLATAADFRRDILRAYRWTQSRMPVLPLRDGTYVPGYPTQVHCPGPIGDFFPGQDHNRSWCYDVELGAHHLVPLGVLDADRPDVGSMMEHLEDVHFLSDGWFDYPAAESHKDPYNLGGFSKVQPYYTRNAEVYAMRDDVKPFIRSYFNTIPSLLSTEILSFWEHFNGMGGWNKTHETGYFLHQTRQMLVQERGDELWLAPFVTRNWLKHGMKVGVQNSPTRFGPVSYRVTSAVNDGHIDVEIDPPVRHPYSQIVLRLRHPENRRVQSVTVNGEEHKDFDPVSEAIRIAPADTRIKVRVGY